MPSPQQPVRVIDTDVHPAPRSAQELRDYLPAAWRDRPFPDRVFDPVGSPVYVAPNKAQRRDAYSPAGGPPASDPEFTEQQLFTDAGVDFAVLIPLTVRPLVNPEHEAALCAATNAWLADTWLSRYNAHGRYRGTLRVCSSNARLAVAEIERWAGHPHFVQVMLNPYTRAPYGQPQYHEIYRAAQRHGLPVALHVNRSPGMGLLTPVGFASYFFEHHSLYPLMYAAHLTSMVAEGVFEKFEQLRVVFIEGGSSWYGPLLWRLDNHFAQFGHELEGARGKPSSVLRDRVLFTSQPIEEPPARSDLHHALEWMDAARVLMFATDYPHWDFDDPLQVLHRLPEQMRSRVLCDNARTLYGLPPTRAADPGDRS